MTGVQTCALPIFGVLSHSGRFRAVFCEQMTFAHLAGAVHEILLGLGGTSLLIVVSVVVETMKQLEAQLMMRNYEGFIR